MCFEASSCVWLGTYTGDALHADPPSLTINCLINSSFFALALKKETVVRLSVGDAASADLL